MSGERGDALEALERILNRGGDADDVLPLGFLTRREASPEPGSAGREGSPVREARMAAAARLMSSKQPGAAGLPSPPTRCTTAGRIGLPPFELPCMSGG